MSWNEVVGSGAGAAIPEGMAALVAEMTAWRRHLHRHPETAFEEVATARYIAERLREFGGITVHEGLAGTGVVGVLESNLPGPSIGLRADTDALDITETSGVAWASTIPGKMHACGHDGHTAMLLGAAKYLTGRRGFRGRVVFIFQPAEENEGGARVMIEQGLFEKFPVDKVFGLHNRPELPAGTMSVAPGPVMAGYDLFRLVITGVGGHAAKPHLAVDPIIIAGHVLVALQSIVSRRANPASALVVTCTRIHAGEAVNAIPARVTIEGTVRCFEPEVQQMAAKALCDIVTLTAAAHGGKAEVDYEYRYPPTVNDPGAAEDARLAAAAVVGADRVGVTVPGTGSEDFAFMLQQRPGAYALLGAGPGPSVHNPSYDFNDAVLSLGAAWWVSVVDSLCQPEP